MRRNLKRYSKYVILLFAFIVLISLFSHPRHENGTIGRSKYKLILGTVTQNYIRSQPDLEPSQIFNYVENVDKILKEWQPSFKKTKQTENVNKNYSEAHFETTKVHKNTLRTTQLIVRNKSKSISKNETNTFEQFLRETAENMKQDSIVKVRSHDPENSERIYVIRRSGKKVKITKTEQLYPSTQVNDFNISYMIPNKNACNGDKKVFILTMVFNQHAEERYRRIVREYWGKEKIVKDKRIQHIFLLGRTPNKLLQRRTEQESKKFGDIIQGDFMDTYKNLTLKTLFGFQYVRDFCQQATFVLKVDSDIIVNYLTLVPHLLQSPDREFVEGHLQTFLYPSRKKFSKWYTPEEEYPEPTYAPYVVGPSYVLSSDVTTRILHAGQYVRFLPWEDAYMGLVLKKLNITHLVNNKGYVIKLKGENIWSKICEIQKYFTFYVGRELDEKRVRFIVDGWHQKVNFCN